MEPLGRKRDVVEEENNGLALDAESDDAEHLALLGTEGIGGTRPAGLR